MCLSIYSSFGQGTVVTSGCDVKFEYDDVGNRVKRFWYCWQNGNSNRPAKEVEASSDPLVSDLVSVFPNPTNGDFTIELSNEPKDAELLISDLKGNIIRKERILKQTHKATLKFCAPGIYMVRIRSNGKSETKRVIKK